MIEYHKIQTVFKRDPENKFKTLLMGDYSLPEFEYLKDLDWQFTEKVDGTNIRVQLSNDKVTFKGKTDDSQIPSTLFERLQERFPIDLMQANFDNPVCLYGEGYGPKIQKGGGNYRSDQDFILFDVKIGEWWLKRSDVEEVAASLSIGVVPLVGTGTLEDMVSQVASGIKSEWGDFQAEGYVARPACELRTRGGERIITKIKCKDFYKG